MEALEQLSDQCLASVHLVEWKNDEEAPWIEAVELAFSQQCALIRAIAADDTLEVALQPMTTATTLQRWNQLGDDLVVHDAGEMAPWSDCIGKALLWAWPMCNQRAPDDDAVQMTFAAPDQLADTVTVQLVTMSSALKLYTVVPQTMDV